MPRGINFNSYKFRAFLRQKDGSFRKIKGTYDVMTSYEWWDEKISSFPMKDFKPF